jgi:putative transposase
MRDYWDEKEKIRVERDVNSAINLKCLEVGIFPRIKRRSGKIVVVGTMTDSITKEILYILNRTARSPHHTHERLMWEYVTKLDFTIKSVIGGNKL